MSNLESLIAEVQQEHREQMTEIGRKRAARETAKRKCGHVFTCEYCGCQFSRQKRNSCHGNPYRFCSVQCNGLAHRKANEKLLRRLAEHGWKLRVIARRLNVNTYTVHRWFKEYGLYRTWQLARYEKCGNQICK